ncbi:DCC1-like thiol-disulfide oxidoreductase family protein [Solitalea sp. MAHUQ-68]|uniref:DCC1-like thiol-disulfide oxidoreductase family protein n=1 Tax=Solitalea agri TaxID=2953739 RepID=A0A9X2F2U3_9SPHI|nr:DCC1-like thiol-disulfide oxidoreductase family protein [Solitalea agri]MCO4291331.1 DCC1-like thiol-disulfide oxidoreductase family protein [Solitalea agri]
MKDKKLIVLFDGVCNLCNKSVQFIIKNDPKGKFMFAALQSNAGKNLLKEFNLDQQDLNSFILIDNNKPRLRSTGVCYVFKNLNGFFPLLYVLIIVPKVIRDWIYNKIAQSRYNLFGKQEQCMIPTPELASRFIS